MRSLSTSVGGCPGDRAGAGSGSSGPGKASLGHRNGTARLSGGLAAWGKGCQGCEETTQVHIKRSQSKRKVTVNLGTHRRLEKKESTIVGYYLTQHLAMCARP